MWTVFLAALPLLQPVAYLLAMIVIWACIPQRAPRIIVICAMALVPLGSAGHVVWRAWTMHEAERAFVEQCRASDSPTVHVKAAGVESLLVDQQARPASAGAAERHPQLVFPVKEAAVYLLEGAVRYARIEYAQQAGAHQRWERGDSPRWISQSPTSRYAAEWRSLETRSEYVTSGLLVVRDVAADRVMAVQRTLLFTSPRVNLLGQEQFGISFRRERAIACPGARQIAIFVKSVAVPAPAPGN